MALDQTLLLYLMIGVAVATGVFLSSTTRRPGEQWFQTVTATIFWPLYLPLLLSRKDRGRADEPLRYAEDDETAAAIAQVDAELESALQSLDGWAEGVLARERGRLQELRLAWTAQAERIRQMDRLLARSDYQAGLGFRLDALPPETMPAADEAAKASVAHRIRDSEEARRHNLQRLRQVRQRTYQDLMGTLAWVRELASMIHLAKFTGAPASRAEELVGQIAAAVEGLSALTWQEELSPSAERSCS